MSDSLGLTTGPPTKQGVLDRLTGTVARYLGLQGLCSAQQLRARLRVHRVELPLGGLDEDLDHVTIAHLSDLHLGLFMRERHIASCVDIVNRARPDFVVITGDFLTTTARRYARRIAALLGELHPKTASLACLGNHDYGLWHPVAGWESRGLAEYLAAQLASAGVVPLINESRTFTRGLGTIRFVGVGERWSSAYKPQVAMAGCDNLPSPRRPRTPTVALAHNPDAAHDLADLGADLILAGHTHGRKPTNSPVRQALFPMLHRGYIAGLYDLPGGKHLYVNCGIGNSRRACANTRPEIALITLRCPSRMGQWEFDGADADRADAPALLEA